MKNITRRTALAAIPAVAAVTALPALSDNPDAGLFADIAKYHRLDPIHSDAQEAREKAEWNGRPYSELKQREDALWATLEAIYDRIVTTPALTVPGIRARLEWRLTPEQIVGLRAGRPDTVSDIELPGEIACALWRDLDRLVSS